MFEDKVLSVIAESQNIPREEISLDATLQELGIDSLDGLNILYEIESDYGVDINIPNERLSAMQNVRDLVSVLKEHIPDELANQMGAQEGES